MSSPLRQPLVAGNWKMNGSMHSAAELAAELANQLSELPGDHAEVAVCPPAVHLQQVIHACAGTAIAVGGQDCSAYENGAHTGEMSALMLADAGCDRVILGHSERRQFQGESSELVAMKAGMVRQNGMIPILCVGESLAEREAGEEQSVVAEQIAPLLSQLESSDVIAYEPVWAIGTGETASPEQAQAMHAFIRGFINEQLGDMADKIRLLYGGSVKAANAEALFGQADIDGGLVGGAALDAREFAAIVEAAG